MTPERQKLVNEIRTAIARQQTEHDVLKTAVTLVDGFSAGFNWTGVYMMHGDALDVGPYIGPETPHTHIELNSGICGAAASMKRTIIVPDVQADPRFLACSVHTRSEIVVPLLDGDQCIGEIDIDSNQPNFFTDEDREMLEEIAATLVSRLKALAHESTP
jgi:GAF domain-containing protein